MERDMKSVSEGTKNKAEVLATSLQQMKACFLDVSRYLVLASYYYLLPWFVYSEDLQSHAINLDIASFELLSKNMLSIFTLGWQTYIWTVFCSNCSLFR